MPGLCTERHGIFSSRCCVRDSLEKVSPFDIAAETYGGKNSINPLDVSKDAMLSDLLTIIREKHIVAIEGEING